MSELFIEMFKWVFKDHPTLLAVLILLFRQNSIKRIINKQLPRQFRDNLEFDVAEMKQDIKEVKYDVKLLKSYEGVVGEWDSNLQLNGQKTIPTLSYKRFFLYLQAVSKRKRRVSKMMEYLKKLGRTKFQVYIVFSIVNIYTLIATLSGHTSISTELDPYMPAINIFAQVVGNWVYTHYQGKVDVVTAQNGGIIDVKPAIDGSSDK